MEKAAKSPVRSRRAFGGSYSRQGAGMPDVQPGLNSTPGAGDAAVSRARVDAPHVLGSPPAQDGAAAVVEASTVETFTVEAQAVSVGAPASAAAWHDIVPQVWAQAEQLAAHLRDRQQQLDH